MVRTRNIPGSIPEPDELYGRDDLIGYIWQQLAGCNILLLAPRRFGKSGIMRHMLLRPHEGYLVLDFELEDATTPQEFVWRVTRRLLTDDLVRKSLSNAKRLPTAITNWVKGTFDEVEFQGAKAKFKESVGEDWKETARAMILEMEKIEPTVVFLLDEFPGMILNFEKHCGTQTAQDFLSWFRQVRLEHKDKLRRHRFVVAGSIGIDAVLRKLEVTDKLNDFHRVYVEPPAEPVIRDLMRDLAETLGITWDEPLEKELISLLGVPVPYFVHVFFSQLGQLPTVTRQKLTTDNLRSVYREKLLGPTCREYFQHYSARLKRHSKTLEKSAMSMLRSVAGAANGRISRSALYDVYRKARGRGAADLEFDELLGDLEHDWYLALDPNTNEYCFKLKIMQDWWQRWYPAARKGGC